MLSPLTSAQVEALNRPMTKKEKLERLACIIEKHPTFIRLVHNMEYWGRMDLEAQCGHNTPMGLAAADPEFKEAGLAGASVNQFNEFFGTTVHDLHEFSCDCGGHITPDQMAAKIRGMNTERPLL